MNRAENGVSGQNLQALLQEGLRAHQAGRLFEAEEIYRRILTADPEHPQALGLLGAIADVASSAGSRRLVPIKGSSRKSPIPSSCPVTSSMTNARSTSFLSQR